MAKILASLFSNGPEGADPFPNLPPCKHCMHRPHRHSDDGPYCVDCPGGNCPGGGYEPLKPCSSSECDC